MTKVEASLFHGMGLGSGNPDHDLAEVPCRLHVHKRIPGLLERKNLIHDRAQSRICNRRILKSTKRWEPFWIGGTS